MNTNVIINRFFFIALNFVQYCSNSKTQKTEAENHPSIHEQKQSSQFKAAEQTKQVIQAGMPQRTSVF